MRKPARILIVDDEVMIGLFLEMELKSRRVY